MTEQYVPEAGDIVWLQFNPQAGHRPALVISPKTYNSKTKLVLCCPMTTKIKGYPFEVLVGDDLNPCAILADQVKSLDWVAQKASRKGTVSPDALLETRAKIATLLELSP